MQTLSFEDIEQVSGGMINACQAILIGSFALEGFLLSGGNPVGAVVGASAGHWIGDAIGGGCAS